MRTQERVRDLSIFFCSMNTLFGNVSLTRSSFLSVTLSSLASPLRPALPELIPGLFGREGRRCRPRIIAVEYIDPKRHIDRCGREWNNNLHCYCEPIRRNQTGPVLSRGPPVPSFPTSLSCKSSCLSHLSFSWFFSPSTPILLVHYLFPSLFTDRLLSVSFFFLPSVLLKVE